MPVSLSDPEREALGAIFADDPRVILKFLETVSFHMAKMEPENAKAWKAMGVKIEEANHAAKPLYKKS